MTIAIFTTFPEYFESPLRTSLLGKAIANDVITFQIIDIREYATDQHRMTDDRPFGGGPGMVMKVEPIDRAVTAWKQAIADQDKQATIQTLLLSASGRQSTQSAIRGLAKLSHLGLVCGHYEGVDERVVTLGIVDGELRVGDLVLSGGEPASLVVADAIARLQPGFLSNAESIQGESHDTPGVGGYPVFTRPDEYSGAVVPPILLSGDHAAILRWREQHRKTISSD